MSVQKDFALPDLGEGLTESEVVSWQVGVGDHVELNQILGEVETAKALVELPSPFAGVVSRLYAEPGSTVKVGAPLVRFEVEGADDSGPQESGGTAGSATEADADSAAGAGRSSGRQPVLVGYGPPVESGARPTRRQRASRPDQSGPRAAPAAAAPRDAPVRERPRSTPPVRKLARDLGVDLSAITGSGPDGLITRGDVESYVTEGVAGRSATEEPVQQAAVIPASASSGRDSRQRETRIPIAGVRKRTAEAMVRSAFTAPQATEFLTVDVTESLELLDEARRMPAFRDRRINLLTVAARALTIAVPRTPEINSRWDEGADEIIQFGYVNLGIAAATPRGLLVPNVKDADRLDFGALADAVSSLVEEARSGRTPPASLAGGTITITNVGVFGVDSGTPILNPGEAAILALGAARLRPWEHHGELALRQVMTLSVSFDHRLVDGEQASRFLTDVGRVLERPGSALLMA
jgi:pyruvate dehydrogenase E2 component (dihydrolipoamide acetyltransferase)